MFSPPAGWQEVAGLQGGGGKNDIVSIVGIMCFQIGVNLAGSWGWMDGLAWRGCLRPVVLLKA